MLVSSRLTKTLCTAILRSVGVRCCCCCYCRVLWSRPFWSQADLRSDHSHYLLKIVHAVFLMHEVNMWVIARNTCSPWYSAYAYCKQIRFLFEMRSVSAKEIAGPREIMAVGKWPCPFDVKRWRKLLLMVSAKRIIDVHTNWLTDGQSNRFRAFICNESYRSNASVFIFQFKYTN